MGAARARLLEATDQAKAARMDFGSMLRVCRSCVCE
jgi:hypothetical protein